MNRFEFLILRMQYAVRDANQSAKILKCTLNVAPLNILIIGNEPVLSTHILTHKITTEC